MSICKHVSNDGLCLLHSETFYKEPCVEGPCRDYTAMTNADRIRAMTDEELADFIARQQFAVVNSIADRFGIDVTLQFIAGRKNMLGWLKKEVGER